MDKKLSKWTVQSWYEANRALYQEGGLETLQDFIDCLNEDYELSGPWMATTPLNPEDLE